MEHKSLTVLACCLGVLVITLGGIVIWQQYTLEGQVFPRTQAASIDLGLQESDALQTLLTERTDAFLRTPVTVVVGNTTAEMTPSALGLTFDSAATIDKVPVITPGESPVTFFTEWILSKNIPLVWHLDKERFTAAMAATFPLASVNAKDATLAWDGETVTVVPEQEGMRFDAQGLQDDLMARAAALTMDGTAALTVTTEKLLPTIHAADLTEQAKTFAERLANEITVVDGARQSTITLKDHPTWWSFDLQYNLALGEVLVPVVVNPTTENELASAGLLKKTVALTFNEDTVDKELITETLAPGFELAPKDVTITQNENGTITFDGDAQNGRWIMRKSFLHSLAIAVNDGITTVNLPMEDIPAKVNAPQALADQGITQLLAVGYSTFRGSPINRMHNIVVGIAKFNGVIIPKGAEFSLGETLGPVDASTGYLPELVIKEGEILPEYGGGLCQVSSTIFRGALFAGLPITQRKAHTYAVAYYALPLGYGLDATVYPPQVDLKFVNDTPGAILIQSFVKGKEVYVKMYGTSDGRSAVLEGPQISTRKTTIREYTNADALPSGISPSVNINPGIFTTIWNRTVTYGDGKVAEDTFTSVYAAAPPHKTN